MAELVFLVLMPTTMSMLMLRAGVEHALAHAHGDSQFQSWCCSRSCPRPLPYAHVELWHCSLLAHGPDLLKYGVAHARAHAHRNGLAVLNANDVHRRWRSPPSSPKIHIWVG